MSDLLSRWRIGSVLGMMFGGERDVYKVLGYTKTLRYEHYVAKYRRQSIARRIINAPPKATWRNPPVIKSQKESFNKAWKKIVAKHRIWDPLEKVDRLARLGNFALLLVGLDDGQSLETPVGNKAVDILYMQPYAQNNVKILQYDANPASARFGRPLFYELDIIDPTKNLLATGSTSTATTVKSKGAMGDSKLRVHYSRVLHVAEDTTDNAILGTPALEAIYNDLDDLLKVTGGTAETFWLAGNRGMQIDIDKDSDLTDADAQELDKEVQEYQHQLRRILRTRGVAVNVLDSNVPDPKNTFDMLISIISGTTGIPRRVLTGSEVGQLASDQDRSNWADIVKERRTSYVEPTILVPLLQMLSDAQLIPKFVPEELDFDWPPNFQLTPLEDAQMMAQKGRAAINLSKQLSEPNPVTTREESRAFLGLPAVPEMGMGTLPTPVDPASIPKKGAGGFGEDPEGIDPDDAADPTEGDSKTDVSSSGQD